MYISHQQNSFSNIYVIVYNIQERNLQIIQDLFHVLFIPCLNIIVNLIFALLINQYFFEITKKSAFVILLCVVVVGFIFLIFFLNIEHH